MKKVNKGWTCGDMALIEFKRNIIVEHYEGDVEFKKDKEYELKMFGFGGDFISVRVNNNSYDIKYKDIYKITRIKDGTYEIYSDEGECIDTNYQVEPYYHPSFYDNGEYV